MQAIKVTHVIASLARRHGGPSYSVPSLAAALARHGTTVRLRSIEDEAGVEGDVTSSLRSTHLANPGFFSRRLRASTTMECALASDVYSGAILHTHGLWLMPNIYPARVKRRSAESALLVHSTRGMLGQAALDVSRWKKRPVWWLWQRSALKMADCLHATAHSEYDEIRAAGLTGPVTVIPNGIDLPGISRHTSCERRRRVVLSLGRVHPKKGLDRLIRAWCQIALEFPDWDLRIVGVAEGGHDQELRALARSLGGTRLTIEGAVYDEAKLRTYCEAELFVLPTLNENFALTVAEALAASLPVISTKGAPWKGLEEERCGWWIDHGVDPLTSALRNAMSLPRVELQAMGLRGRAWMARDFSWDRIATDMLDVYRWLKYGGLPPSSVRVT